MACGPIWGPQAGKFLRFWVWFCSEKSARSLPPPEKNGHRASSLRPEEIPPPEKTARSLRAPESSELALSARAKPPTTALQPTALLARLYSLCSVDFLPPSYSLDGRFEGPTPFIGQLASAPRCAATSLLLRSCTVVLTIKRWDAPRPVSLSPADSKVIRPLSARCLRPPRLHPAFATK